MSKTTMALLVKLVVTCAAAWVTLGLFNGDNIGYILILAVVGTIVNYLLGDLIILPAAGNAIASIGDGIMGVLIAYILDITVRGFVTSMISLIIFFILITVFEFGFHIYLVKSPKVAP